MMSLTLVKLLLISYIFAFILLLKIQKENFIRSQEDISFVNSSKFLIINTVVELIIIRLVVRKIIVLISLIISKKWREKTRPRK